MINLDDYVLINVCDCNDSHYYFSILLNKKHKVEEFQKRIDELRVELAENIEKYGDDWTQISEHLGDFDYIELNGNDKVFF